MMLLSSCFHSYDSLMTFEFVEENDFIFFNFSVIIKEIESDSRFASFSYAAMQRDAAEQETFRSYEENWRYSD